MLLPDPVGNTTFCFCFTDQPSPVRAGIFVLSNTLASTPSLGILLCLCLASDGSRSSILPAMLLGTPFLPRPGKERRPSPEVSLAICATRTTVPNGPASRTFLSSNN